MAIQLRYSLGRTPGANIAVDPTFIAGCGVNWTCEKDWSLPGAPNAVFLATGPGQVRRGLRQNNLLTTGQRYRVTFDCTVWTSGNMWVFVGDYLANPPLGTINTGSYSFDATCLSANTDFGFYGDDGFSDFTIQNLNVFPLEWNTPLTIEPIMLATTTLTPSQVVESLSLGFIDSIKFIGDGYDYFLDNYGEGKTPLRIEINDGSGWQDLTDGEVYFSDRGLDYEKKEIILKYEDKSIMNVLNKGKDTKVAFYIDTGLDVDQRILTSAGGDDVFDLVELHNPATGAYTDTTYLFRLFYCFMITVHQISEVDIHVDAGPLENMSDLGGAATDFLGVINGESLNAPAHLNTMYLSFQDIVDQFYRLSNIAIVPRLVGGVKTLVMELRNSFIVDSGITFNDVFGITEFKSPFEFRSFQTGFSKPDININNEDAQYVSENVFYDGDKDLVCDWVQNGTIIWDVAANANVDYQSDIHMVEYFDDLGTWRSQIFGANFYNGDIDTADNIARFADIMTGDYLRNPGAGGPEDTITGTSTYVRIFAFDFPFTIDQFQILLNNPYAFVRINSTYIDLSSGIAVNTQGYIIELDYDILKNIGTFKMLVQ